MEYLDKYLKDRVKSLGNVISEYEQKCIELEGDMLECGDECLKRDLDYYKRTIDKLSFALREIDTIIWYAERVNNGE